MHKLKLLARRFAAWRCQRFHVRHWARVEPGKRECSKCHRVYRSQWNAKGHVSHNDKRLPS